MFALGSSSFIDDTERLLATIYIFPSSLQFNCWINDKAIIKVNIFNCLTNTVLDQQIYYHTPTYTLNIKIYSD